MPDTVDRLADTAFYLLLSGVIIFNSLNHFVIRKESVGYDTLLSYNIFAGIYMALYHRWKTTAGQVVPNQPQRNRSQHS
ncbi:hypothetical protein HCH54_003777 [Aspergillus fumigatus]